jgi:hypothetical protein
MHHQDVPDDERELSLRLSGEKGARGPFSILSRKP